MRAGEQFQDANGALAPVALFDADAKVSETRLESFTRYSWQFSRAPYLEGSIDTAYSKLRQRGNDVSTDRSFFYPKPRLDLRYQIETRGKLNARIFRTVSQLDFANFVSSISSSDVRFGVIQAGNPNLVPEKTWTFAKLRASSGLAATKVRSPCAPITTTSPTPSTRLLSRPMWRAPATLVTASPMAPNRK